MTHPYGQNIRTDLPWPDQNDARRAAAATVAAPIAKWQSTALVADGSSGDSELELRVAGEMAALFDLFKKRQRKYGPGNIAAFGDLGVCVRAQDKLARLRHHYFGGGAGDMPDESVDDAWRDLAVYAVIALVCREGGWPGLEKGGK